MSHFDQAYHNIIDRLDGLRRREKKLNLANGLLLFLIVLLPALLISISVEAIFYLKSWQRVLLLGFFIIANVTAFVWFVGRPIFFILFRTDLPGDTSLAIRVGKQFTSIRDRLVDAIQLFQKHDKNREGYSLELADASLAQVHEETKDVNYASVATTDKLLKLSRVSFASVAVFSLFLFVFRSSFSEAALRLRHPSVEFENKTTTSLNVIPGDAEIIKGEDLQVQVQISGDEGHEVQLLVKQSEAKEFEQIRVSANSEGQFSYLFENVRQDFDYIVKTKKQESPSYSIFVIERPFVRNLQVRLIYPSYSKLGSQYLDENVGDVTALMGTEVHLAVQTNKRVSKATLKFDDNSTIPLKISDRDVSGRFTLRRSGNYKFELSDQKDLTNEAPITYRLSMIEDQFPVVQITLPGQDVDIGKDMLLALSIEAEDDFGFSNARLGYRILQSGIHEKELMYTKLPFPQDATDKMLLNHNWDLSKLEISPEDIVSYFVEVFDNDDISGPKSSKSLTYEVRFPSIHEIFDNVARTHEESFDELEDLYEESKSLKRTLDEVIQEMKRDPELDWQEKQQVQEAIQAQENMRNKLEQLHEKLDEMVNKMEQNDLISFKTMEKYRELQELMQEMLTPELKEALEQLQKSMEELDPQKLQEAMQKFSANQEDFMRSLERTMNLLKKLQIEQQLDESVRRAQELLRRQEELNENASASEKQESSKYAQEQKGIRQDTEKLEQQLEDLKKKMSEFPQMSQEQIESARQQVSKDGLQQQMQQATQQFQSGQLSSAQKTGKQISQELQEVIQNLQSAQQELSEDQKQAIMRALRQSSNDLLKLSKQQEQLKQSTKGMDRNSPGMNERADKQQDMLSGLSRVTNELYELSQNTFFVTSETGEALGKAMKGMKGSLQGFEGRNPGKSGQQQGKAMSGLNEAAASLRKSMQGLNGASSGIGFQEMMQRLLGMSGQQQGINQQTSGLGQKPGQMNQQQLAAMTRLAAEQNAVRKSLEQLLKEYGDGSEILGDLQKVSADMQEVVAELQRQNLNRSVTEKQQRILSRLLDAQHSIHNRDYRRKRRAETAQQYQAMNPEALPTYKSSAKDRLRNELLRAMKEGYSKDYKELIRKYFEALVKKQAEVLNN